MHILGLGAGDHGIQRRDVRVLIRVGGGAVIQHDRIETAAHIQTPDFGPKRGGHRPVFRCHAQDLRGCRHIGMVHPRHAVHRQGHAHFLQHVAVFVDARFVHTHAHGHAALLQFHQRQHTRPQAEVGRTVVAHAGAGACADLNIFLGHPDTMANCQLWPQNPQLFQMLDSGCSSPAAGVLLLVGGFQ